MKPIDRRLSVAPMMDWTDRHCRYFLRLLSHHTVLYTEMVTTGAILHGDQDHLLGFHDSEHPIAVQLGGSDPKALAECSKIAEDRSYDEINLNVGCPSDRVQNGAFGACLMARPALVAECIAAMQQAVNIPVTVKCRIGIDDLDSYEHLADFVSQVSEAGCDTFLVHARKAILSGLSPKENREIPPLDYPRVYRLKHAFPHLNIVINGGIKTLTETESHLESVDGVMIGREAYHNPYMLAEADQRLFASDQPILTRHDIMARYIAYVEERLAEGTYLKHMSRHVLGLFAGQPGARQFRRHISEHCYRPDAGIEVLKQAASLVKEQASSPPTAISCN